MYTNLQSCEKLFFTAELFDIIFPSAKSVLFIEFECGYKTLPREGGTREGNLRYSIIVLSYCTVNCAISLAIGEVIPCIDIKGLQRGLEVWCTFSVCTRV